MANDELAGVKTALERLYAILSDVDQNLDTIAANVELLNKTVAKVAESQAKLLKNQQNIAEFDEKFFKR